MAVRLKFTDKCENCPNANLVLRRVKEFERTYWYVNCIHEEWCRYLERKLQNKEREGDA